MSSDIAISVENVSKAYRIWNAPAARLKAPLIRAGMSVFPKGFGLRQRLDAKAASYYRDFYALKDISFQVRKGESVGIIGRNGSGKSTLLQIIAGTLQPTSGSVQVNGRVAALLELGSGFNPEFTGRENVYLNAAVLGLTRAETDAKFDSIAAFADIGDFLDQPVKTYSSGMMMRLGFACMIHVDPDILIVDEALAVGDIRFQRKCKDWITRLIERKVTFLLVSHSPPEVTQLTKLAALLDHGRLLRFGTSREVVIDYQRVLFGEEIPPAAPDLPKATTEPVPDLDGKAAVLRQVRDLPIDSGVRTDLVAAAVKALAACPPASSAIEFRHGDRTAEIIDFGILDEHGQRAAIVPSGQPKLLFFRGVALADFPSLFAAFVIRNVNGVELFYTNTELQQIDTGPVSRGDLFQATSLVTFWLAPGDYFLSPVARNGATLNALDRRMDAFHFQVTVDARTFGGLTNLQAEFEFHRLGRVDVA